MLPSGPLNWSCLPSQMVRKNSLNITLLPQRRMSHDGRLPLSWCECPCTAGVPSEPTMGGQVAETIKTTEDSRYLICLLYHNEYQKLLHGRVLGPLRKLDVESHVSISRPAHSRRRGTVNHWVNGRHSLCGDKDTCMKWQTWPPAHAESAQSYRRDHLDN